MVQEVLVLGDFALSLVEARNLLCAITTLQRFRDLVRVEFFEDQLRMSIRQISFRGLE